MCDATYLSNGTNCGTYLNNHQNAIFKAYLNDENKFKDVFDEIYSNVEEEILKSLDGIS